MTKDQFKKYRLELGYKSQKALAERLGYSRATIARAENIGVGEKLIKVFELLIEKEGLCLKKNLHLKTT